MQEVEGERLVGDTRPWAAMYLGFVMTAVDFRDGRRRSEKNE